MGYDAQNINFGTGGFQMPAFNGSTRDNRMPVMGDSPTIRDNRMPAPDTDMPVIRDNRMPVFEDQPMIRDNRMSGGMMAFADGGEVPAQDIFASTLRRREQEAGLQPQSQSQQQPQGITINIGTAGDQKQEGKVPVSEAQTPSMGQLANSIMKLIGGFQDGGRIRSGSSDVKAGGEIRGPESKSGKDNQIIKVAGGEGILPKDVMDVPGVADLVQSLIQTYHTPIKK